MNCKRIVPTPQPRMSARLAGLPRQAGFPVLATWALVAALALLTALALLATPAARAAEVDAVGTAAVLNGNVASARNQALINAQRNAVEQGVGLILDSKTVAQNFQIIQDQVLTSSQGFVTRYTIVSEGPTPDRQSYQVRIKAEVAQNLLQDKLSALRILSKKMGNKRVMVVYQSSNAHALARNHGATTAALDTITDGLNQAGFRVFDQAATAKVYQQIEQAARVDRPVDDLIAMALDNQADILIRFEIIGGERGTEGGMFSAAYTTLRMTAYDTGTGRQIADSQVEGKQLLRANAGPYDWEKGLGEAANKAAQEGTNELIDKIANYYKQVGDVGFAYLLIFKGYNDDDKDKILDYLENTPGFKQLSERKNAPEYLEVELFSSEEASRLRRMIRAGLADKGI
ncbi:MAG TPA: DUF6175 family protein, partial [bacterium]|nr:DUF6175 family protein [bacterium]